MVNANITNHKATCSHVTSSDTYNSCCIGTKIEEIWKFTNVKSMLIIMPPKKTDLFSKDIEFTLINLVECRPILWDCTSELYKRVDLKEEVWEEVARSLGPRFSGSIVASRFKSMRDTFMSNLRRVKESKRSGKGTADIYIPKWPLYDRLKFLQKAAVQSASISNLTISSEKPDDTMSQIEEQTSNESLTQWPPCIAEEAQEEIVAEKSTVLNVYYDSTEQFMIQPMEELSDNSTDLSISSRSVASTSHTPAALTKPLSSVPKIQDAENQMYIKRGQAKRKSDTLMEEAVGAIKVLCKPEPKTTLDDSSTPTDSAFTLGSFIAARLRQMTPDQ
ncbi:uncharacterized protein LOC112466398, partial [Temnothorax curvispinosus]|uniref:Uncharacterized protein LOC112466398 n=1 Tax=Temnothorax curvispinosus TaxID=300111 RepID=A0A6J1R5D5_9HYME